MEIREIMSALFSFKAQTRANYIIINGITRAMEERKIQLTSPRPPPPSAVCLSKAVTVCPDWGGGDEEISHRAVPVTVVLWCHRGENDPELSLFLGPLLWPHLRPAGSSLHQQVLSPSALSVHVVVAFEAWRVCYVARVNCYKCSRPLISIQVCRCCCHHLEPRLQWDSG